jgi:hypothetical protein
MYYQIIIAGLTLVGFFMGLYAKQIVGALSQLKFNRKPKPNNLVKRIEVLESKLKNREKNLKQSVRAEVNDYLNNLKK